MTKRKDVEQVARSIGAVIDDNSDSSRFDVTIDAPRGMVWACDSVHSIVGNQRKGFGAEAVSELWSDLLDRMRYGLEDCNDKDCDVCAEALSTQGNGQ